jgi:hypothetical protein
MRRELVEALQVLGAEAAVGAGSEALGGLGGVLGDIPRDLLGRQLSRLVVASGDVADVELLAPAGIARWAVVQRRTRRPDGRDRLLDGVLE